MDNFALKCTGFIHDNEYRDDDPIWLGFCVTCAYPTSLDVRSMLEDFEYDALRQASPTEVTEVSIKIKSRFKRPPRFRYLKLIENWMVVARHLRDDFTELARLRSRFEETYLLVEVGSGPGGNIDKRPGGRYEPGLPMTSTFAFAAVPLADEAALLALFNGQSTQLNLLEQSGRLVHLPSVDCYVVNISALDLRTNRVAKLLGEGQFYPTRYSGQLPITNYVARAKCAFDSFEQIGYSFLAFRRWLLSLPLG